MLAFYSVLDPVLITHTLNYIPRIILWLLLMHGKLGAMYFRTLNHLNVPVLFLHTDTLRAQIEIVFFCH
jgi:hypothetical protein